MGGIDVSPTLFSWLQTKLIPLNGVYFFMGVFSFACTLCAFKINMALVGVEFGLTLGFSLLADCKSSTHTEDMLKDALVTVRRLVVRLASLPRYVGGICSSS